MSKTYLFIDDEATSRASAEPYAVEIMDAAKGELKVDSYAPTSIETVLAYIVKAKPDGLLLDVAFEHALTPEKAQVSYDGIALAQQIRTLQTRRSGGWAEFPLVRFSKANIINQYVGGDTTSDDLFDEKIDKPSTLSDPGPVARKLLSLATDYPRISDYLANEQSDESLAHLLGCGPEFLSRLDARALLGLRQPNAPAHILSRFVIGPLLGRAGPIIDEALLAVRLGINREESADWPAILDNLKGAFYQGVYSQGYERWWMALVLDWWSERIDSERALFRLGADERVQAIQKIGIGKLTPISENVDSPGTKFWNLCLKSRRPVDPAFGFPLLPDLRQETWHDVDYLCLEEARRDPRSTRLGAAERTRLAKLRKGSA
jgi:hypothetical protein